MSEVLHMIQLQPDPARLVRFLQSQNLNRYRDEDLGYGIHAWLAAAFGALAPKPYRLLGERRQGALRLLAYTSYDPAALAEHARTFAEPLAAAVCDLEDLCCPKRMPDAWQNGRRLGFEVLACPISRQDKTEKDIFLRRVEHTQATEGLKRDEVYAEWLAGQLVSSARLEEVRLAGFRLVRMLRRAQSNNDAEPRRAIRIVRPQALLGGTLVVRDGAAFAAALARGIGRHRAFGYGMLLLRPVR